MDKLVKGNKVGNIIKVVTTIYKLLKWLFGFWFVSSRHVFSVKCNNI